MADLKSMLRQNITTCVRYAIARPSVVSLLSVTFVSPTQAIKIFGNVSSLSAICSNVLL